MKLVFICSPYREDPTLNTLRAQRYCRFAYSQGAVPIAPHLHNTQFLDDKNPKERELGIQLGIEILSRADEIWCFGNKISSGMEIELKAAKHFSLPVRYFTDKCVEIVE